MEKDIRIFAEEVLELDIPRHCFEVPQPRKLVSDRKPSRFFITSQQEKFKNLNLQVTKSSQHISREYSKVLEAMCDEFLRRFNPTNLYLTRGELANKYKTSEYYLTMELINCKDLEDFYILRITKLNIILDEIRFTITTKYGGI